jgi:transcriptional regulator with XRE-family HTH domain
MVLGPRVRERRTALGLSQENLAHQAGVSLNAVHKLEAGRITDPHFSTLSGIARALDMTVAELVGEETRPKASAPPETGPSLSGPAPSRYYTAFEAFGQALAFAWEEDLAEWNEKVPDGEWASAFDFARLVQWMLEIAGTKAVYKAVGEMEAPPRAELTDTLRLLDEAYRAAMDKVIRAFEPVKTFKEFQKIWEASDMDAVVNDAQRR